MSDALTDIARDERRARAFDNFARRVLDYVSNFPAPMTFILGSHGDVGVAIGKRYEAVKLAAQEVDEVPRGYWSGRTTLLAGVNALLCGLTEHDEKVWAQWLIEVDGDSDLYAKFLSLSPFAGKVLVLKRYKTLEYASVDSWAYTQKVDLGDISVLVFDPPKVVVLKERK